MNSNPILAALDVPDPEQALALARSIAPHVGGFKIGLELFTAGGAAVVQSVKALEKEVFLDLKFHDIPNTVAKAVANATRYKVDMLTVHCAGGPEMLKAAEESAMETAESLAIHPPLILGVTVLTSMDQAQLEAIGVPARVEDQVANLATMASKSKLRGLVCSPLELERLRSLMPPSVCLVTPGIRAKHDPADDQKRTLGPRQAIEAGANRLVIGRPIYAAQDPVDAARSIANTLIP
ncbi:MAG: orotidine-5'-phosphate decarboxylase [Verrucomicrobiota bacterium]|jgi:orotidine-5'-phosphate decarboxylase|nr:orotidine-5'-phosphate decarboxylase [Verrucomicrobiota bacterium]